MDAFLSAMDAVWKAIGPLGGALAGFLLGDMLRWRREDRQRWNASKRELYARLLTASEAYDDAMTTRFHEIGRRLDGGRPLDSVPPPPSIEPVRMAYEEIRLLAPRDVVQAALDLAAPLLEIDAAHRAWIAAAAAADPRTDDWRRNGDEMTEGRTLFLKAARADLGVEDLGNSITR